MQQVLIILTFVVLSIAKPPQKIKSFCFVYQGTSVCPLCPERTGLLCEPVNEDIITTTEIDVTEVVANETDSFYNLTDYNITTTVNEEEITTVTVKNEVTEEFCYDNGGCDCPFICCYQGKGKPKKCTRGMLLPPGLGFK